MVQICVVLIPVELNTVELIPLQANCCRSTYFRPYCCRPLSCRFFIVGLIIVELVMQCQIQLFQICIICKLIPVGNIPVGLIIVEPCPLDIKTVEAILVDINRGHIRVLNFRRAAKFSKRRTHCQVLCHKRRAI